MLSPIKRATGFSNLRRVPILYSESRAQNTTTTATATTTATTDLSNLSNLSSRSLVSLLKKDPTTAQPIAALEDSKAWLKRATERENLSRTIYLTYTLTRHHR